MTRRRDEAERVTVGCGPRQLDCADHAAGAALVVDHEGPAEAAREVVADQAADGIVAATRRGGDDEAHGFGRPRSLAATDGGAHDHWSSERCSKQASSQHEAFPPRRSI